MSRPLVSIVMPVYNSELYLKEAIDSVLNQTYSNLELVLINDGSVDSSREIIQSYSDDRIRLISNDRNSGIVFSRNRGLELANGEFIATLDSDDFAFPDRIEKQLKFLLDNPEYGMCGTFYCEIDKRGNLIRNIIFPTKSVDIRTYLLFGNCFCNSTIMLRSELAKELKYRENYDIVEDYELWYRISRMKKLANLSFFGTKYRVHGNNISVSKVNDMLARVRKINRQILIDLHLDFNDDDLDLHSNFLSRNYDYFANEKVLKKAESWIYDFYAKVKADSTFNNELLFSLISINWIMITYKTKHYKHLIFNRLTGLNRSIYIKNLVSRIIGKVKRF